MKAEVEVINIGPFLGSSTFYFQSEKINVLEAPNASGKSSIIKSIAASLSFPAKSSITRDISRRLGILPNNPRDNNPLVNNRAEECEVNIITDVIKRQMTVSKRGTPRVHPHGDDRFLLTGLLVRESEIVRRIDDGEDDFSWLISILSLSNNYESIDRTINEKMILIRDELQKLEKTNVLIINYNKELMNLKDERQSIMKERNILEENFRKFMDIDPKIVKELNSLEIERDNLETSISNVHGEILELNTIKEKLEKSIKLSKGKLSEIEKSLKNIEEEIKKLPKEKEIKSAEKEAYEIRKNTIPTLREEIGKNKAKYDLLKQAEKWVSSKRDSIPCPLCEEVNASIVGLIPVNAFNTSLNDLKDKNRELNTKNVKSIKRAEDLEASRIDTDRKRNYYLVRKQDLNPQYASLKQEIQESERQIKPLSIKLKNITEDYEKDNKNINEVKKKINKLQKQQGGDQKDELLDDIGKVEQNLGKITEKMSFIENEIASKNNITIENKIYSIINSINIYQNYNERLHELKSYINQQIINQKQGAANLFNKQISVLLQQTNFNDLKIWVDNDTYKLNVQKIDNLGIQDLSIVSLSSSQSRIVATLLTIAAKEAYTPDIPFFLIDEVLLDFDESRLNSLSKYLLEKSKEQDLFIVVSKLGGSKLTIKQVEEL